MTLDVPQRFPESEGGGDLQGIQFAFLTVVHQDDGFA